MKHIIKGQEPVRFREWKDNANEDWTPTYKQLSGEVKKAVFEALKIEQGFICCYCERKLTDNDFHIEHLNPQEKEEIDPLDFSNMLCSCQRNLKKNDPIHCGNSKKNWYVKNEFISPLDATCEDKFKYTYNGQILPLDKGDKVALNTINVLKLDIDKLNDLRNKVIEPFLDPELSEEDLLEFSTQFLAEKETNNGEYNEFHTTIKFLFG